MKNFINFLTLILCVIASSVNAQNVNVSQSNSIVLSQGFAKVANVVEDFDAADSEVRSIAMMQEEVSPEVETVVATAALSQGFHKVPNVIEDIDTEDVSVRNIAMMQEEISPEAPETNMAGNYEEVSAKY